MLLLYLPVLYGFPCHTRIWIRERPWWFPTGNWTCRLPCLGSRTHGGNDLEGRIPTNKNTHNNKKTIVPIYLLVSYEYLATVSKSLILIEYFLLLKKRWRVVNYLRIITRQYNVNITCYNYSFHDSMTYKIFWNLYIIFTENICNKSIKSNIILRIFINRISKNI